MLGFVCFFFLSYVVIGFSSFKIVLDGFRKVERRHVEVGIERLKDAFDLQIESLENKFVDWAVWDDAYNYLKHSDKAFERSTLAPESILTAKVDLLGWQTAHRSWVWIKTIDANSKKLSGPSKELLNYLNSHKDLFNFEMNQKPKSGLLQLPELGIVFATIHPVLKSNGEGPIVGSLISLRKIDAAMIERLNQLTRLKINFNPLYHSSGSANAQQLNHDSVIEKSESLILGSTSLSDMNNQRIAEVSFEIERDIYAEGVKSMWYTFLALATIGLIAAWAICSFLKIVVIARVEKLNSRIERFIKLPASDRIIDDMGADEIGRLARTMTKNLKELDAANELIELERVKATHLSKLASLGEMSAGIAHEINNPLGIILGHLHLLEKYQEQSDRFRLKVKSIQKATMRIDKIVQGLKKYSHSSEKIERNEIDLEKIVNDALVITESKAKHFDVVVSLEVNLTGKIVANEVEIEQVIINLVNNAIDATKSLVDRWVQIKCFEDGDSTVMQVIDSGSGISSEIEFKLFEPFYTTKSIGEGTGLGLSIVKGILDQHKATIKVNREVHNTCFEVRFSKSPDLFDLERQKKNAA